jgi:replicative DNA helicase
MLTVAESLERSGKLADAGGQATSALAQNTPSAANIRRYAEIVRERRHAQLASGGTEIADSALQSRWARSAQELIDEAEARCSDRGGRGQGAAGFRQDRSAADRDGRAHRQLYSRESRATSSGSPRDSSTSTA